LRNVCSRHTCVVSSVHWLERWRSETIARLCILLEELGVEEHRVDVGRIGRRALAVVRARGWSGSRLLDMMRVLAALPLDCNGIIAVDGFIARRAKEYGLLPT